MVAAGAGTQSQIRLEYQTYPNAAGNYTDVNWQLYFEETGTANAAFHTDATIPWSVTINALGTVGSGGYAFDWRPAGKQSVNIANGSNRIYHGSDGTPPDSGISAATGATGSSGGGGGASVGGSLGLVTLKVLPGTPTKPVATRIDDTSTKLDWTQTSASNGQPTSVLIQKRENGGAWVDVVGLGNVTTANVATQANTKTEYQVRSGNAAGTTAFSPTSDPIYTTPGAPTAVTAAKDAGLNIVVGWTPHVNFTEHTHEVWHGTVTGGVTTWDGSALATVPAGTSTYTHVTPNSAQVHIYEVRAGAGALTSSYAVSPSVQLLTAPGKPTIPATPPFSDKAAIFRFNWVHNAIDSTPQTKRQTRYSTDGGATWTTSAKTVSTDQFLDYAAGTWAANAAVTFEVRTKGSYDSGADGDASYSPWSDPITVTFKTAPTTTITSPANGANYTDGTLRATIGFAQTEGATFVKAQLQLLQGATLLESLESVIQVGITFATPVANGTTYSVKARVQDSNGVWSAWVTSTFPVVYLSPVPAVPVLSFLPDTGWGQLALTIAAPGGGQAAATTITITRTIDGVTETIVKDYPVSAALTFLDTTPIINGANAYTFVTKSALGAQTRVDATLTTHELRRAYLSKGSGYSSVVCFGANPSIDEALSVASDTIEAAGRTKPIGLYGVETSVVLKVESFIYEGFGSTIPQIRTLLLQTGKACYRDSSNRRIFGSVKGGVSYKKATRGDLSFTLTETS